MRRSRGILATIGSVALAACGGGEGGVASTPTPTAAAPTPTPTNISLTPLQYSQRFTVPEVTISTSVTRSNPRAGPAPSGQPSDPLVLSYDAATQSYTVTGPGLEQTFGPSSRDAAGSNATITAYKTVDGPTTTNFALFNAGAGNPKIALTYTSYGAVQRLVDNGATVGVSQFYFVYGIPTAASDLPRSGMASYQTALDGTWIGNGDVYALAGTSSLSADFAAGTTNLRLVLGGTSVLNGGTRTFDTFAGTGRIDTAAGTFTGPLTPTTSAYAGSYAGRFFGPGAIEAGATFAVTDKAGGTAIGTVVGKR